MKEGKQSQFDLLKGKAVFSSETFRQKMTILIIMMVFILILAIILRGWNLPFMIVNWCGEMVERMPKFWKGRSP